MPCRRDCPRHPERRIPCLRSCTALGSRTDPCLRKASSSLGGAAWVVVLALACRWHRAVKDPAATWSRAANLAALSPLPGGRGCSGRLWWLLSPQPLPSAGSPSCAVGTWAHRRTPGARRWSQRLQPDTARGAPALSSAARLHLWVPARQPAVTQGPAPLSPAGTLVPGPLSQQVLLTLQELLIKLIVPSSP